MPYLWAMSFPILTDIERDAGTINEYYLRDHTGRELLVYDNNTGRLKMVNIFGNGLMGRIDVEWESVYVQNEMGFWYWQMAKCGSVGR